jgi:hypothetical protein
VSKENISDYSTSSSIVMPPHPSAATRANHSTGDASDTIDDGGNTNAASSNKKKNRKPTKKEKFCYEKYTHFRPAPKDLFEPIETILTGKLTLHSEDFISDSAVKFHFDSSKVDGSKVDGENGSKVVGDNELPVYVTRHILDIFFNLTRTMAVPFGHDQELFYSKQLIDLVTNEDWTSIIKLVDHSPLMKFLFRLFIEPDDRIDLGSFQIPRTPGDSIHLTGDILDIVMMGTMHMHRSGFFLDFGKGNKDPSFRVNFMTTVLNFAKLGGHDEVEGLNLIRKMDRYYLSRMVGFLSGRYVYGEFSSSCSSIYDSKRHFDSFDWNEQLMAVNRFVVRY